MKPAPLVATIIPYFQRTPGLLSACVASILSQSGGHRRHVVIADDESPIPAEDELAAEVLRDSRVTVVKQKNAGPGAARNTALDHVPADTTYVALMDSDDAWRDGFLDCAMPVLEQGYDIFFADSRRYHQKESRFRWNANPALNLAGDGHHRLDAGAQVFGFEGDFFDLVLRRSNILGPSTTIYRLSLYPELRFSRRLFNGQDRLFKLHLTQRVRKAAFTTQEFGIEGEGINIFDSAAWGRRKSLNLLSSYIQLPKTILAEVDLQPAHRLFVKTQLSQSRHSFVASMVHLLAHGEKLPTELVLKTFKADPASVALLLPNLVRVLGRKLGGNGAGVVPPGA
jgi:succinoglycan biosynthesis protein ExoW